MKIYFLGTCAGTEPMPLRKHASIAVEVKGQLYWIDAGEGCSYTAHNMGLDLLSVKRIIISHCHMDHVGGLGNLLWNIRKLNYMRNSLPYNGDIELYMPVYETFEGIMKILKNTEGGFETEFNINYHNIDNGVLFEDENVCVKAFANKHLCYMPDGDKLSYSFRIEAEGKSLVYSGDVGEYADLDPVVGKGCNGLIIETGHYGVDAACEYVGTKDIEKVFFSHNGREILNFPKESEAKIKNCLGGRGIICYDTMTAEI